MHQEKFDNEVIAAIQATIKQGKRGSSGKGGCAYLSSDGCRCPVGHMMTDEEINQFGDFDRSVTHLYDAGWRPTLTSRQLNVLILLQQCHDFVTGDFVSEFKSNIAHRLPQYKVSCDD